MPHANSAGQNRKPWNGQMLQTTCAPKIANAAISQTALVYEPAGDREKALKALERAIRNGASRLEIANEPELASLRSAPPLSADSRGRCRTQEEVVCCESKEN
jgi:hypothetical protein